MLKTRLKELREGAGYSQASLADKIGVSYSGYQNYEYGKRDIPADVLAKLADLYDVTIDYILRVSHIRNIKNVTTSGFTDIPLYGSIAAGTPIEMIEIEGTHPVPTKVADKYPDAFLLKVKGESMNRILPNGCYALIDPCDDVDYDGKPYAVCVNGFDATIKRVKKLNNGFQLIPDSNDPTYVTETYNYNEPNTEIITVIGRVVYFVLPFDWGF